MLQRYPLAILLFVLAVFIGQAKGQSSAEYKSPLNYYKIVTQTKAIIENTGNKLTTYKGEPIEKADGEEDAEYFAVKTPVFLSSNAYIIHYKNAAPFNVGFSFIKFDNNKDAEEFGEHLAESLIKGTYSFGKLKYATSGEEGLIELTVIPNGLATSKTFPKLHIFIKVPNEFGGNKLQNEVQVWTSKW